MVVLVVVVVRCCVVRSGEDGDEFRSPYTRVPFISRGV